MSTATSPQALGEYLRTRLKHLEQYKGEMEARLDEQFSDLERRLNDGNLPIGRPEFSRHYHHLEYVVANTFRCTILGKRIAGSRRHDRWFGKSIRRLLLLPRVNCAYDVNRQNTRHDRESERHDRDDQRDFGRNGHLPPGDASLDVVDNISHDPSAPPKSQGSQAPSPITTNASVGS